MLRHQIDRSVMVARLDRVRQALKDQGLDALVATKPQTFFYLSDFNPVIFSHPTMVVLPATGDPTLLVWALRLDHAKAEAAIDDVQLFGRWGDKPYLSLDPYEALRRVLEMKGLTRGHLGVEEDHLSAKLLRRLQGLLPEATLSDASPIIDHARLVKDGEEISRMRMAARLADEGMMAAVEALRERRTEIEVAMRGEQAMRALLVREYPDHEVAGFAGGEGAVWTALWCWVQSGPRIRLNDTPKAVRIGDGTLAIPQVWAALDGYTVENERTVAVGPVSREVRRVFESVVAAREAAFAAVRPGATCADVYEAAAAVFRQAGYERHLPGRIGHSIGIGPHEHLSLAPEEKMALVPGMALTIEPGVHIPEGGIRHADTIIVTEQGQETLTQTPRGVLSV